MEKKQRSPKASSKKTTYSFYVRYPPDEIGSNETWKAQATEFDLGSETALLLRMRKSSFEETQNPVYALEAFLIADEAKLYPPFWVLEWLINAFKKYHTSLGNQDQLDELLGFKKGPGQNKAFKDIVIEDRNVMLLDDMARVRAYFGVSVTDAAYMVFRREEDTPNSEWNKTSFKIDKISDRYLQDLYNSNPWCEEWKEEIKKSGPTLKQKKEYLKKFPEDSLPLGINIRLK